MAIILPKNDDDSINLLASSVIISFGISLLSLVLLFIFYSNILSFFENPDIGSYLYLAPLTILFQGIYQAFSNWSIRNKTFKTNSLSSASQSLTGTGSQFILGVTKHGAIGLILGTIIGQFVSMIIIIWKPINNLKHFTDKITLKKIKSNLVVYKNFALINTPHTFVGKFQESGLIFFIKSFISVNIVGEYSIAIRVLSTPTSLLAKSVNQVFYARASKHYNDGLSVKPLMYSIHKKIFLVGLPFFLILTFLAPYIFEFVFSSSYKQAGIIAGILSPWLFLNFIASSTQSVFLILNKLKQVFLFSLIDLSLRILALFIGYLHNDYKIAFIYMSLFCSIFLIVTLIWTYKIAGNTLNK